MRRRSHFRKSCLAIESEVTSVGQTALKAAAAATFAVLVATRIAGARELQLIAAQDDLVAPKRHFPAERIA